MRPTTRRWAAVTSPASWSHLDRDQARRAIIHPRSDCPIVPALWRPLGPGSNRICMRALDSAGMPFGVRQADACAVLRCRRSVRALRARSSRWMLWASTSLPKRKATGVVRVARDSSAWSATTVTGPLDDDTLVDAVRTVDLVGVDSPLGWPVAFVDAVEAHDSLRSWPGGVDRSTLTHRDTDRAIREHGIRAALSVSADKLGSVAMRCLWWGQSNTWTNGWV